MYNLNTMGSKPGCYIPLPITTALSLVLYKIEQKYYIGTTSVLYKIEQTWMCQSYGILQLPSSLLETVVLPLHLYLSYGSIPKHGDISVENVQQIDFELSLGVYLDHIPINHMVRSMYIFLKQRDMKNIMSSSGSKQCNYICNCPYYFKHFK